MHQDHFDRIQALAASRTARRGLLGGVLGMLGLSVTGSEFDARKKRRCKSPRIKCGKKCLAAGACCTNADCTAVIGQVCVGNACECPSGQAAAGNACAVPCNPACDECQRCDDGACVDLADDTPCTESGTCQAGVCTPDRSFGCVAAQNACGSFSGVSCPNSTTPDAVCFVDGAGDSVCGTGLCTNVTTDTECIALLGAGAFVQPCSLCSLGGKTRVCVKPVTE